MKSEYLCWSMIDAKVIVIDDNAAVLKAMGMVLKGAFTKVVTVEDPQLIPALIAAGDVDAVLDGRIDAFLRDNLLYRHEQAQK